MNPRVTAVCGITGSVCDFLPSVDHVLDQVGTTKWCSVKPGSPVRSSLVRRGLLWSAVVRPPPTAGSLSGGYNY